MSCSRAKGLICFLRSRIKYSLISNIGRTWGNMNLRNYVELSHWEADSLSSGVKIPHVLWNPKIQYRGIQFTTPILFLSDPFNIILPSTHISSEWSGS